MKAFLEGLYLVYNRRELVHPDPLEFLYNYDEPPDREIAGLVASCLAYGRVGQILKSVEKALTPLGARPRDFLTQNSFDLRPALNEAYKNFKHRFTTGGHMADLLARVSETIRSHGSLEEFMRRCLKEGGSVLPALDIFSRALSPARGGFSMLPSPGDGSACKRLFLFLKWMTRRDEVDPGGWTVFSPRDLVMPTDTHVHNIARQLGLTERKQADLKTALEITHAFAAFSPDDPTRYDFAITRFGIRGELRVSELIQSCPTRIPQCHS
ncbi:MAG: TIGR02757 family protein [Synergistaceae bacterium]|nr:TIGR02757 family protein [Synergistaceae bacterium]